MLQLKEPSYSSLRQHPERQETASPQITVQHRCTTNTSLLPTLQLQTKHLHSLNQYHYFAINMALKQITEDQTVQTGTLDSYSQGILTQQLEVMVSSWISYLLNLQI